MIAVVAVSAALAASTEHHVAQAEAFARRGWWRDAVDEVDAALATPEGAVDYAANALGARMHHAVGDLERAVALGRRAADLCPDDDARAALDAWVYSLESAFGVVELRGPEPGIRSRLQLEALTPPFDPEHKRWVAQRTLELHERVVLPRRVGLPAGRYRVNGLEVEVSAGSTSFLDLPAGRVGAEGLLLLQVARLEANVGASAWIGAAADGLAPSPFAELSVTAPAGPVLLGLAASWEPRVHTTPVGVAQDPSGAGLLARVAREIPLGSSLIARPSLGVRGVRLPGLTLACDLAGAGFACAPIGTDRPDPDARLRVTGWGAGPAADVTLAWRHAGRTTAAGLAVTIGVEHVFGAVFPGEARVVGEADARPWTLEAAEWRATGIRLSSGFSFAF